MAQKCIKEGCKKYPLRGSDYCQWHGPDNLRPPGKSGSSQTEQKSGLYSRLLSKEEQVFLDKVAEIMRGSNSLDEEIAVTRLALARALQSEKPEVITRTALAVGRLYQMKHQLEGEQATGIVEAMNEILRELGLGEN